MVGDRGVPHSRRSTHAVAHIGQATRIGLVEQFESDPGGPAGVIWRPPATERLNRLVEAALDRLEQVAVELVPVWLPDVEGISGGGASEHAVRRLALEVGATVSDRYGPYLADLAGRWLQPTARARQVFPPEIRAREVARLIAAGLERHELVLAVEVAVGPGPVAERALVGAAEFLARHGRLSVWLFGSELAGVDWIPRFRPVQIGPTVADPVASTAPDCWYPPIAGRPHPASRSEQALEQALAGQSWAAGRAWNQHYAPDPLVQPVRIDLTWLAERLAVEIDGPEHRDPHHYEADRRRDLRLTLDGFTVVRFTNDYLTEDLTRAVGELEQLVRTRRTPTRRNHDEHGQVDPQGSSAPGAADGRGQGPHQHRAARDLPGHPRR